MSFPKLETPASASRLSGICLGLGAALTLGVSSWTYGQDCGAGDVSSGEACLVDGDEDTVNGGCNSTPAVFEPANVGGSIDGTVSTLVVDGAERRDTDWYLVTAGELAAADVDGNGIVRLSHTGFAEGPVVLFIVAIGDPLCDSATVIGTTGFAGPGCADGEPSEAVIDINDHPNGIVFYIAPGNPDGTTITSGYACDTGDNDYVITMEITEPPTSCAPGSGPCNIPNGSPGCEDPECCAAVCATDPICCILDWDQQCADAAIMIGCAGLPCPVSSCKGGQCTLSQSQNSFIDSGNQVACQTPDGNTTPNFWARCYNLVTEGVPANENLTINSVTFGIAQATIDGINVDVNLYLDCDGCPPAEPDFDAVLLATQSVVVNTADVGTMITVSFPAGTVVPAGSDLIVEIGNPDDGTAEPLFAFRTMSNDVGQCAPSYIRTDGSCGLGGWTDLADIDFPDSHLIQTVSASVGGVISTECAKIPEACGKGAGSCGEPNGSPGCEDEICCALVCADDPICCILDWDQLCADAAIMLGCAIGPGLSADIATGPDENEDAYLRVGSDAFGSWTSVGFGGLGDTYNPVGSEPPLEATFAQAFSIYRQAQGEAEILSTVEDLQNVCGKDGTMTRFVTSAPDPVDTNDDGVPDTRTSTFDVTSQSGLNISIELTQHVETVAPLVGDPVALMSLELVITNNGPAVDFILHRHQDYDMVWGVGDFADDNVGTGTNSSKADRFVYQGEAGDPATHITLSSPQGDVYYGGKQGVNPDPGDPLCVPYDFGTDLQICQNPDGPGTPDCWKNNIAGVGDNTDGDSGANVGDDGFIGMEIPVSLAAEGVTTVSVLLTYGAKVPGDSGGPPPCPADIDGNGTVGSNDLVLLLFNWGPCGDCNNCAADIDGNCTVGSNDLVLLLFNWGPCP